MSHHTLGRCSSALENVVHDLILALHACQLCLQLCYGDGAILYQSGKDAILAARATACLGDAYVGLEDYKTALGYFEKAAATVDNVYTAGYLLKAGAVAEELGDDAKALSFYKRILDEYPHSMEAYDVDKYIGRIENK